MQRRKILLLYLASIALLGTFKGFSSAQKDRALGSSKSVSPKSQLGQTATSEHKHAARTPYERIFAPGLKKLLGQQRNGPVQTTRKAVKSAQVSAGSATPTFGGFYAGSTWLIQTDAVAQADPSNWGAVWSVSADFNKDGHPDVVTISSDGILSMVLNNGSGGFLAPVINFDALPLGASISYLGVGDFNNDGYPDLVAIDTNNNQLLIFLNQGNGTFGTPTTVPSPAAGQVDAIAVGDVNADGNLDIAAISSGYSYPGTEVTLQVFTGNGNGTFNQPTNATTTVVNIPEGVEVDPGNMLLADINKDQELDLVYSFNKTPGSFIWQTDAFVALGNNSGSFSGFATLPPVISTETDGNQNVEGYGVYLVDLNNDQKLDLVLSGAAGIFSALGNGNGTFQPAQQAASPEAESGPLAFADVNGDGLLDVIVGANYLEVYPGLGDGTFGMPLSNYVANFLTLGGLIVSDFNGDGVLDIGSAGPDVTIYFGKGAGLYAAAPTLFSPANPVAYPTDLTLFAAGDFTGNGNTDVSLLYEPPGLEVSLLSGLSDGKGNFSYVASMPTSEYPDLLYVEPATADFNGDGKKDILLVALHGMAVALSNGDGTFQTPVSLPLGTLDCELAYAATADLTGNGNQDIVVLYPGDASCGGPGSIPSGYFVILGNGDGTFAAPQFYSAGSELYSVTIADINGDGIPDLLLDDAPFYVAGQFAVYSAFGSGNGTFGALLPVAPGYVVSQVSVTDFNQDGKADLVLFCEGAQTSNGPDLAGAGIFLFAGVGDGKFLAPTELATGTYFLNGAIADVNGDGLPDIVASPYFPGGDGGDGFANVVVSTFLNQGGGSFSTAIGTPGPVQSVNLFVGNFLSDNAPDIVLESASGTALLLNQSGTLATLAASVSSAAQGGAVVLTATIAPSISSRPTPTGTVTFFSGSTTLGTGMLAGGVASLSVTSLPVGTDPVSAAYSGDTNFNPNSQGVPVSVTVTGVSPAFTMTSAAPTLSLSAGQIATTTLTLIANSAFSGSVSLTASGLPQGVSILFTPSTVSLSAGQMATATLVVSNSQSATAAIRSDGMAGAAPGLMLAFALLPALLLMSDRKKPRARARAACTVLMLACVGMLSSCSSSSSSSNSAGSGQSTIANIVVNAAPSNSSATSQSITVTVTVQN
jgi:hypothetical protein